MASKISELLSHGDESDKNHKNEDYEYDWSTGSPTEEDDCNDDDGHHDGMALCMSGLSLCVGKLPLFDDEDDQQHDYQYESGDHTDDELSDKMDELTGEEDDRVSDSGSKLGGQDWSAYLGLMEPLTASGDQESRDRKGNRETLLENAWEMRCKAMMLMGCADKIREENNDDAYGDSLCCPGRADGDHHESTATTSGGCMQLVMDMDEMEACKELGFEVKMSPFYSSMDNGSWRISGPGADPSDVKARLKLWARIVAAVCTARLFG